MKLVAKNIEAINKWLDSMIYQGYSLVSHKGPAPKGATYSDGTLIENYINVAWECVETGEKVYIDYA